MENNANKVYVFTRVDDNLYVELVSTVVDSQRKPVPQGGGILRISNTGYSKFRITMKTTYYKYWEYREPDISNIPYRTKNQIYTQ